MKPFSRKEILFPLLLFLLALGLRLIYLNQLRGSPLFDAPIMDAKYHDQWAQAILRGQPFHEGPYFRAPLYAYFLAGIYALFGHGYLFPRILQFAIGSFSCLLIYRLGKRTFGPMVGRVAAILAALYGTFIYFEGELLIPSLILFLDLSLILAVLAAEEKPAWWSWLGCGAILGLSAIARPNVLLFGVVLLPWLVVRLRRRGLGWRKALMHVIAVVLGTALVIAPVTIRNYFIGKDFVPIASQGGVNFFIGNNRDANGYMAWAPGTRPDWWGGYWDAVQLAEEAEGGPLKASQVSNYWFKRGLEFMRDEPKAALGLLGKKLVLFWSGPEIGNNKDIYFFSRRTPPLNLLLWPRPIFCPFGIIAPLALTGMALAWRRREGRIGLMVLFIFSYMASIVPFFVTARHRLPAVPFLLPFAGYALVSLLRSKGFIRIVWPVGLLLILALLVNLNLAGVPSLSGVESHMTVGHAYREKKLYPQAVAEFQQALSIDPQHVRSIAGLARVYGEMGDTNMTIELWQRAIALRPDEWEFHFLLGFSYYFKERYDDAIIEWQETTRLKPEFPTAYLELGKACREKGLYQEALTAFQQALQVYPQYAAAYYHLGQISLELGQVDEAVEHIRRAVELNPQYAEALHGLAKLYGRLGQNLDQGVELARRAVELDGSRGAYWETLAELYLKKGQRGEAIEIFRRMMLQQPDNPHWRERLDQVGE